MFWVKLQHPKQPCARRGTVPLTPPRCAPAQPTAGGAEAPTPACCMTLVHPGHCLLVRARRGALHQRNRGRPELALQRGLLQLHVALVLDGRLQLGLGRRQALPARVRAQQRVAGARQTLRGSLPDRVAGTLRGRPMPLMTRVGPVARYSKSLAGARRSVQAQSVPQDERSARACQLRRALAGSWARGSTRPPCGNRRVVEDRARITPSMQHGRTWSCPGPCACGRWPAGRPCSSSARCPAPP